MPPSCPTGSGLCSIVLQYTYLFPPHSRLLPTPASNSQQDGGHPDHCIKRLKASTLALLCKMPLPSQSESPSIYFIFMKDMEPTFGLAFTAM
ncbi:hypothetical protein PCASD_20300 [Puccinia coronata f. sp. avenae]|uniref:Uncharacterized protein n=1 Tax=Puccinia coronata f. sp. avenae TaxID=200324 RepID=A0A2N5SPP1_9BASI|nr:hypothetical protein PCASD_20300 [Puccinia coronata f. sp. avenae]